MLKARAGKLWKLYHQVHIICAHLFMYIVIRSTHAYLGFRCIIVIGWQVMLGGYCRNNEKSVQNIRQTRVIHCSYSSLGVPSFGYTSMQEEIPLCY